MATRRHYTSFLLYILYRRGLDLGLWRIGINCPEPLGVLLTYKKTIATLGHTIDDLRASPRVLSKLSFRESFT